MKQGLGYLYLYYAVSGHTCKPDKGRFEDTIVYWVIITPKLILYLYKLSEIESLLSFMFGKRLEIVSVSFAREKITLILSLSL